MGVVGPDLSPYLDGIGGGRPAGRLARRRVGQCQAPGFVEAGLSGAGGCRL